MESNNLITSIRNELKLLNITFLFLNSFSFHFAQKAHIIMKINYSQIKNHAFPALLKSTHSHEKKITIKLTSII